MKLWYVLMGALGFAAIMHISYPKAATPQSTYYTDRNGLPIGQAWSFGDQTFYTDIVGRPMGSVATNGPVPASGLGIPTPIQPETFRIEPIRPIEPIQPLRLQ